MTPEHWQHIKTLLQSALEREPGERSAFLAAACADDDLLRKEVESLITSHEQAGGFIESPAFEVMAESLGDQTDSLAGQSFGPYQIIARIGIGGMGEVYLAEDSRLGRKVALKMLPTFFTEDKDRVRRFQQEARAASALNHPNILTIYEIGQIAARHFIATEFIEGETLRRRMSRTQMRINEALEVSIQVASALSAAHQAAIAHRDIKPGNIMLRPDAVVKVLDFGLAKLTEPKTGESEAATLVNTKQGMVMGTAHYMSPEQTRGQRVDARTDIWSLAVVLYEMTTGRLPFEGPTASDVISVILQKEPLSPARHAPEVPPELERIITKALRKDREERYQTVKDMLLDLKSLKQRLEFEAELERSLPPGAEGKASAKSKRAAKVETVKKRKGVLSGSSRAVSGQRRARKAIESLAVLPLINASEDPNLDYLSDGITESIINNLSQVPRLRVFARSTMFRYKGQAAEPKTVGQELGARAVLMGRVLQQGDRLVVGVELVDAIDETQLWGEHYNRRLGDVFEVQDEIAREITEKLRLKLSPAEKGRLKKRHTESIEAYQAYLKGRYFWYKRTEEALRKSIEYFNQAIEEDPSYAAAYDGLSDSYALLALRGIIAPREGLLKAKAAARKALEIDDTLGEAYASLAHVRLHDWDWSGLEEEFKRALELNPGHAIAYHWYSEYLMTVGRADESIAIIKQGQETDPLSPVITATLGFAFLFARKYDRAIEQFRKALELDPNHFLSHYRLGHIYSLKGSHQEAIEEAQKSVALSGRSTETLAGLAQVYAAAGMSEEMQKVLDELNERSKERYVSPYYVAKIYASLGEKEQAVAWLEKGYEERNPDFIELKVEPVLDVLRTDERFRDLLRRVGLASAETFPAAHATGPVPKLPSRKPVSRKGIKSLAILPFTNTSADPNMDYLSDGITESIINSLSQLPKLRVLARSTVFRYKGREVDPQHAGRELGVQAVLTGRVQKIGERLIIGTELVDVDDGSQLWGEQHHRAMADIFELQEEISGQISEALRLKVSGAQKKRLMKRHTKDTQAYELYLKGRFFWNKRTQEDANRGIECFQQALSLDPNFALAYTGLADCQILLGDVRLQALLPKEAFLQGRASALRALELDPDLAEAHGTLGHVSMHLFDWSRAEKELQRALELNPNDAQACLWQAYYYAFTGHFDDSIAAIECALQLDPLALPVNASAGELLYFAGRVDDSIEQFHKTIEMDAHFRPAHMELARVYEHRAMYDAAFAEFAKARELSQNGPESLASLAHCYAVSGATTEAQNLLRQLTEMSESRYVSSYEIALIHSGLGQKEECFEWLNRAYEIHDGWMIYITVDPRWKTSRSDPRFIEIVRRVGLAPLPEEERISTGYETHLETHLPIQRATSRAIAVLPFRPISSIGRDEYLELGMADALITKLSNIGQIVVRPTSSVRKYTDLEQDSTVAGRELKVESVLEGSIQRRDDWLRVTARLVSVADGRTLWADKFDEDFTDIFAVQDSISEKVAAALALKLTGEEKERLTKRYTENTAAYQFYLRGLHFFNKRSAEGYKKAIEYYQQAIEIDPNYALAYTGLADCYANSSIAEISPKDAIIKARTAAMKALEIDDTLAEAHNALAHVKVNLDWDWSGAEGEFKLALALNPNYAEGHHRYTHYLVAMGRFEESLTESLRGLELDPLDLTMNTHLGWHYLMARQEDQAIEQLKRTLELDQSFINARLYLGQAYERKGMYAEAIAEFQKLKTLYGESQVASGLLGYTYAVSGQREDAQKIMEELKEQSQREYVWPYNIAIIHVGLGEKDQAFEWLEKACQDRSDELIYLKVEPMFDPLRSDPRFEELLKKIGLEK